LAFFSVEKTSPCPTVPVVSGFSRKRLQDARDRAAISMINIFFIDFEY
jgi:hypothetical protein